MCAARIMRTSRVDKRSASTTAPDLFGNLRIWMARLPRSKCREVTLHRILVHVKHATHAAASTAIAGIRRFRFARFGIVVVDHELGSCDLVHCTI